MLERDSVDGLDRQNTLDLWDRLEEWQPALQKGREALALSEEFAEEPARTEMRVVHLMNEIMFAATWLYFVWAREKDPDVYKGRWCDCREEWTRCLSVIRMSYEQLSKDWPALREEFTTPERPPFNDILEICDRLEQRLIAT